MYIHTPNNIYLSKYSCMYVCLCKYKVCMLIVSSLSAVPYCWTLTFEWCVFLAVPSSGMHKVLLYPHCRICIELPPPSILNKRYTKTVILIILLTFTKTSCICFGLVSLWMLGWIPTVFCSKKRIYCLGWCKDMYSVCVFFAEFVFNRRFFRT